MIHVVGERGQLGRSLVDTKCASPLGAISPGDVVINCAAITDHMLCNIDPDKAWRSNVDLVKQLVETCRQSNAFLIHISSDYVFNKEFATILNEDSVSKIQAGNTYAMTKFVAEQYLRICKFENWICVRTSWLFSPYKACSWLSNPTVWDQYGSPVWAPNFAEALIHLTTQLSIIKRKEFYHFTNNKIVSRQQLASHYRDKPTLTVRAPSDRPYCSALKNIKMNWEIKPLGPFEIVDKYKEYHGPYYGVNT